MQISKGLCVGMITLLAHTFMVMHINHVAHG